MILVTLTGTSNGGQFSVYLDSFSVVRVQGGRPRVSSIVLVVVDIPPQRWHRSEWWNVRRYKLVLTRGRGWEPLRDAGNTGMSDSDMGLVVRWVKVNIGRLSRWLVACPISVDLQISAKAAGTDDDFKSYRDEDI